MEELVVKIHLFRTGPFPVCVFDPPRDFPSGQNQKTRTMLTGLQSRAVRKHVSNHSGINYQPLTSWGRISFIIKIIPESSQIITESWQMITNHYNCIIPESHRITTNHYNSINSFNCTHLPDLHQAQPPLNEAAAVAWKARRKARCWMAKSFQQWKGGW